MARTTSGNEKERGMPLTVNRTRFLMKAEEIAAGNPSYRVGGTGKDGTCDCIGLVIGAIRRAGGKWTGRKGTNWTARNEMRELQEIGSAAELKVGEAVLKAHEPGEAGYDAATIQRSYASSPDQRDYYHIGIVTSVSPLEILHMTSPAAKRDGKLGRWRFHGRLKQVDYGAAVETGNKVPAVRAPSEVERVQIAGGNTALPINQRAGATRKARIIARIPQNAEAEVLSRGGDWCRVRYAGRTGYVMTCFIA